MTKKEFRFFTIADHEDEEIWLREQHKQGWRYVKMSFPGVYTFESCEPEDVVYRLDFNNKFAEPDYFRIYEDFGWTYAGKCNNFYYFRKPASETECEEEQEIFSDNESKLAMVQNILLSRMLPILAIFLCCGIPTFIRSFESPAAYFLKAFWAVLLLPYIYLIVHCGTKLLKMKKKYSK